MNQQTSSAIVSFENVLISYKERLTEILRNKLDFTTFKDGIINVIKEKPTLLNYDRDSFLGAIFSAANLGLYPSTQLSLCFFKGLYDKATNKRLAKLEIGYQGWLEIVLRNPEIESITTDVWRETEVFFHESGLEPNLKHTPAQQDRTKLNPLAVYAIASYKDGTKKFVVLYRDEIEVIKKLALERDPYGVWSDESLDPFKWMWRKTAIKQLAKELPKLHGTGRAIEHDNLIETGGYVVLNRAGQPIVVDNKGHDLRRRQTAKSKKVTEHYKTLFDK